MTVDTASEVTRSESAASFTKIFSKTTQYTGKSISTFEHTFGKHYMSAGGQDMTRLMAEAVQPETIPGCQMLDIGFGIGGAAFDFCDIYGATVHGIDLNEDGYAMAQQELDRRNVECKSKAKPPLPITFQVQDAMDADFEPESFHVIYSRDTFVHLSAIAKEAVFRKCLTWLKPGGKICIGDYSLGRNSDSNSDSNSKTSNLNGKPTPVMADYLSARGYHMYTPTDYGKALEQVGFTNVDAQDMAYWYCTMCQTEMDRVAQPGPTRDQCLAEQGEEQVAKLEKTYRDKVQMTLRGDRSYALVTATKQLQQEQGSTTAAMAAIANLQLCQTVVDAYQTMTKTGQVMSCDGNISARVDDKSFLVTPTGINAPDVQASQIVLCDLKGKTLSETYKPTSEVDLHTLIYQSRPDVGAIVHSHSIYACAIACCRLPLPPAHYAVCEFFCDTSKCLAQAKDAVVKCSTYHTYGTFELATACLTALGDNYACFLANHGAVVVGKDMEEAMYLTERLERECEIYWRAKQLARPIPLTPEEIRSLHLRDQTYGQEPELTATTATDTAAAATTATDTDTDTSAADLAASISSSSSSDEGAAENSAE